MKRYILAVDDIHAPSQLKAKVISEERRPRRRAPRWAGPLAAVLALAIIAGVIFLPGDGITAQALCEPVYPSMAPYPGENGEGYDEWRESRRAQLNQAEGYGDGLWGFTEQMNQELLAGDENGVYSPLSVYLALSMLSEVTDGNTRGQILTALGANTIEDVRQNASALWNAAYCDDGAYTSILGSSIWLQDALQYNSQTLQALADTYYASSYAGALGSDEMNRALQSWLNDNTGGLLKDQAENVELTADTVLALCTTVYFQAKWSHEFNEANTREGVFHAPSGDVTVDFMHQSTTSGTYYWGDKFGAVVRGLEAGGSMYLILPDEGVTTQELLADGQLMEFVQARWGEWENSKSLIVNLAMPKFDISCDTGLIDSLGALGIEDVTDPALADFSPLLSGESALAVPEIYLSQARHAARVAVDEEGVTAAAFTEMAAAGAGEPPEEEIDFTLDRPFIFVITGLDGLPLFLGVVNEP